MMLLNQQKVPGHNMSVRANFRLEDKDISGQSSATDTAEAGIKPQTLSVSLTIGHDHSADLTRLIAMARATDLAGKRQVYKIVNDTAKAGNIRQVRFTDNFTYSENDTLRQWQVNFTLREYQSVPEKIEQRQEQPAATEQAAEGETVASVETVTPEPQYSGFKGMLKKFDEALGA